MRVECVNKDAMSLESLRASACDVPHFGWIALFKETRREGGNRRSGIRVLMWKRGRLRASLFSLKDLDHIKRLGRA
jgi:hypothetical protein